MSDETTSFDMVSGPGGHPGVGDTVYDDRDAIVGQIGFIYIQTGRYSWAVRLTPTHTLDPVEVRTTAVLGQDRQVIGRRLIIVGKPSVHDMRGAQVPS